MSDIYQAYMSGRDVRHAWFVYFAFKSSSYRVWNGFRNIDIEGNTWSPVGPKATVEQIEDPISDSVPSIVLKVSGVDADLLAAALASTDEIRGRLAFIYDHFFDEDWQPLGDLASYATVRMDTIKVIRKPNEDGSADQTIELTCEHFLTQGPYPPYGRYTSADQAARYPVSPYGQDKYFDFMPQNQNRRQRWPTF